MKLQIYVKDDGYFAAGQKQFQITNSKSGGQFSEISISYRKLKEFNPADHPAIPKPPVSDWVHQIKSKIRLIEMMH
jgi:hypothetical protein